MVPTLGDEVEDDPPAFAVEVIRPVVMGDDDLTAPRVTPCGDESAAIARTEKAGRAGHLMLRVVPGDVIVRQLLEGVQRDDVVNPQRDASGFDPFDDALQFFLVLRVNLRPEHFAGRCAEKLPAAL